ncbi:MAG TPA: SCP2 sterol-binding domain-containing protein [Saprospiraceae bacterium]|nr:SCP2 sterol-binding domain-containing protein [Chitinophagales bacterium]HNA95254.1 SCP2 sterol-binding domain-containing protein [Saprospiraceae bacterium]HMU68716.1 SCP2 sterol-binding domain-containing protein [Chitinophagales bacterium]HMX03514.1 SCP2 sterol-binding domain-containing protein [Chitinophagales bacterium]HMZ88972.1 SCP2 sterol-binding domain-containing protein [Chitinophagales bacterium]
MQKPISAREIVLSLKDRFRPEKAEAGYETVFHLDISGDRGGQFTVTIANGTINIEDGFHGNPKCIVTTKDEVYEDTEWGRSNPQMAVMFGKIKVSDLGEILDFIPLFHRCEEYYQ